jgi:hypothetical protein
MGRLLSSVGGVEGAESRKALIFSSSSLALLCVSRKGEGTERRHGRKRRRESEGEGDGSQGAVKVAPSFFCPSAVSLSSPPPRPRWIIDCCPDRTLHGVQRGARRRKKRRKQHFSSTPNDFRPSTASFFLLERTNPFRSCCPEFFQWAFSSTESTESTRWRRQKEGEKRLGPEVEVDWTRDTPLPTFCRWRSSLLLAALLLLPHSTHTSTTRHPHSTRLDLLFRTLLPLFHLAATTMVKLFERIEDRPTPAAVYNWRVYSCAIVAASAAIMIGFVSSFFDRRRSGGC